MRNNNKIYIVEEWQLKVEEEEVVVVEKEKEKIRQKGDKEATVGKEQYGFSNLVEDSLVG